MKGYVAQKGNSWYAVIYHGLDPVTGHEQRSWHPAGAERSDAERLARRLAAEINGRNDASRSLTFEPRRTLSPAPKPFRSARATQKQSSSE